MIDGMFPLKNHVIMLKLLRYRIFFYILIAFTIFIVNCTTPCEKYKKIACEEPNSGLCHEAMQKTNDMSPDECREKIRILKSGEFKITE